MATPTSSFASADDLAERWRPLAAGEASRAETLLEDASVLVVTEYPRAVGLAPGVLRMVVCSMVRRAMTPDDAAGSSALTVSETALGFSHSTTRQITNPDGALFLAAAERALIEKALDGVNAGESGAVCVTTTGL